MMLNASDILGAGVLIVDDQDSNVKLPERLLGEAGYTNVASTCRCRVWMNGTYLSNQLEQADRKWLIAKGRGG
jgi:CheY-like chemotaxis protein